MKFSLFTSTLFALLLPNLTHAKTFGEYVTSIYKGIIPPLIPVLVGIAVLVFIWGVIKYLTAADDPEKAKEGMKTITWGVIGLFVIISVWGLVAILVNLFGFGSFRTLPKPDAPPSRIFPTPETQKKDSENCRKINDFVEICETTDN